MVFTVSNLMFPSVLPVGEQKDCIQFHLTNWQICSPSVEVILLDMPVKASGTSLTCGMAASLNDPLNKYSF